MCMHICALIVSLSSDALACGAVSLMCMRVCVHMYAYAYVFMCIYIDVHFFCSERCVHFWTGVLGTIACADVYIIQVYIGH